jgi:uncharacterized coiled-coil protein SlyX
MDDFYVPWDGGERYVKKLEARIAELDTAYDKLNIAFIELNLENQRLRELLTLIHDDLRMRADEGVVDISNFIWERINAALLGGGG